MSVYLDASALVKLYVEENGSADVHRHVGDATSVISSEIAFVEVHSALSRRRRDGSLREGDYRQTRSDFERDWGRMATVPAVAPLLEIAARLAQSYPLRALDAIHLATARDLQASRTGVVIAGVGVEVARLVFLSADRRLTDAARQERLEVRAVPL